MNELLKPASRRLAGPVDKIPMETGEGNSLSGQTAVMIKPLKKYDALKA